MGIKYFNQRRRAALLCALAWAGLAAVPAHAASSTGTSRVVVVTPLSLVNTAPLSFGNLIAGPTAGTVTINETTQARTVTGGVSQAGGTISAASFTGMTDGWPFWVDVDAPTPATITLTRVGGGATMQVNTFTVQGGVGTRFVWINSIFTFRVGGRLMVGANQMAGTYNGTFNVTVNYQ